MELHVQSNADEDMIDELVKHEVEKIVDDEPEEKEEETETTNSEEKVLSFEKLFSDSDDVRVISEDGNWEGELRFGKDKDSWVFYPRDEQAEPIDYESNDLKEVKEDIELEYEDLLKERAEEREMEDEAERKRNEFLKSLKEN